MVTITLPSGLEAWLKDQVRSGRAVSVDRLVAEALEAHRALDDRHKDLVAEAYVSLRRGEVYDGDEVDAELDRWIAEDAAADR